MRVIPLLMGRRRFDSYSRLCFLSCCGRLMVKSPVHERHVLIYPCCAHNKLGNMLGEMCVQLALAAFLSLVSPKRQVAKPNEGRNRLNRRQLQALPVCGSRAVTIKGGQTDGKTSSPLV
jgi:hypothetical protein